LVSYILVVDEELDTHLLFEQNFKKEISSGKFNFYYANSSEEALNQLNCNDFKTDLVVILSDIDMPGISGIDLLKMIKIKCPHLPVFMIIAYGSIEKTLLAWENGAEEVISKPLNFSYLKSLITDMLRKKQLKGRDSAND
jgi:DNA-binding NtrC family response regulator